MLLTFYKVEIYLCHPVHQLNVGFSLIRWWLNYWVEILQIPSSYPVCYPTGNSIPSSYTKGQKLVLLKLGLWCKKIKKEKCTGVGFISSHHIALKSLNNCNLTFVRLLIPYILRFSAIYHQI